MAYKDPSKQKDAQRRWYLKNKIRILEEQKANRPKANERNIKSRQSKRAWINELKESTPCTDCKTSYPARVMDFDHVRGEKVGNIGMMLSASASWKLLKEEVSKCDIVCANCHRLRH